jgi:hypothetical protein
MGVNDVDAAGAHPVDSFESAVPAKSGPGAAIRRPSASRSGAAQASQSPEGIMSDIAGQLIPVGLSLLLPLAIPGAVYLAVSRQACRVWPSVVTYEPLEVETAGPYRGPAMPILVPREVRTGGPPWVVRAAAFASYFLGQMFVPGLLFGLIGIYFFGLGLISLPGLYLAWKIFGLGTALLNRDPGAADRADRAARFAFILNAVVLVVGFVFALNSSFGFFLIGYAVVSIGHGALLRGAASKLREVSAIEP